ncbi:hypothetical protein VNO80_32856 [Phaseolus coccineus]|uniref:Uncharacterized protein n=1 Tax=Phaseolus coccineus TaxID=3886 RepID=A0AAN9KYA5_PHACN
MGGCVATSYIADPPVRVLGQHGWMLPVILELIRATNPRLLEGTHLLDKRSTQALPVALMIHDNSSDRTALVPATHHSNFCPINFRW